MKIGVLGTGVVGETIGSKLTALGHDVMMGSRNAGGDAVLAWAKKSGGKPGSFAHACEHGEIVFHCTKGEGAIPALNGVNLSGKILIDVTNPLGMNIPDSLGEQIQEAQPEARVVKALNCVNAELMVNPAQLAGGEHDLFICGNDEAAKKTVVDTVLKGFFGWKHIHDLGDITASKQIEGYVQLWVRMWRTFKTPMFNVHVMRQ